MRAWCEFGPSWRLRKAHPTRARAQCAPGVNSEPLVRAVDAALVRSPGMLPDHSALDTVRRAILAWYDAAHRDFPWRGLTDPFAVLVSEVMLQQTHAQWTNVRPA